MEDEELKMIPTRGKKDKIPRTLSYVTGAKALSLAFQEVPQFEFLRLGYWCRVAYDLRASNQLKCVLDISYSRRRLTQYDFHGWNNEADQASQWNITVRACHREDVHEVREWLQNQGFDSARQWLQQCAHSHGEYVYLYWRALFDEDSRDFDIQHG